MGKKATVYLIGTPGQPWQSPEKASWLQTRRIRRSYQNDVVEPLRHFADNSNTFRWEQYGTLDVDGGDNLPLYAIVPRAPSKNKPWALVTGGTHGYETSGVLGALRFLSSGRAGKYLSDINVVVVPCVCPWGYERIERWVQTAVDPNRSFGRMVDGEKEPVRSQESLALMKFLDSIGADSTGSVHWLCHLDLHETTDTDSSEFCPAKAARDGEMEYDCHIPDGFYLVGDTTVDRQQLDWYREIIGAVEKITHIAEAEEDNTLIGEQVVSPGVVLVPKKKLGLCAGGAVPGAKYLVTTEVYPDSVRTNPEECVMAQVETVCAAFDYLLEHEIGKRETEIAIRRAVEDEWSSVKDFHVANHLDESCHCPGERERLKDFHVANHLDETCHCPGERERQVCDLCEDFPHFNSVESLRCGKFWVATDGDLNIVGSIGLLPDKSDPRSISWLNTFSVAKNMRGRGIGSRLMAEALGAVKTERVRLVALGGHSKGIDVMGLARLMYEKNGFILYKSKTLSFGQDTTIDLLYYEKTIP